MGFINHSILEASTNESLTKHATFSVKRSLKGGYAAEGPPIRRNREIEISEKELKERLEFEEEQERKFSAAENRLSQLRKEIHLMREEKLAKLKEEISKNEVDAKYLLKKIQDIQHRPDKGHIFACDWESISGQSEGICTANNIQEETKLYGSYQEVIVDEQVDVVYISLPSSLHVEWGVKAADKNKHILLEKPQLYRLKTWTVMAFN
eukprot:Gb_07517 [translate_table: standard]